MVPPILGGMKKHEILTANFIQKPRFYVAFFWDTRYNLFLKWTFFISESGNSSQKEAGVDYMDETHYYNDYGQYFDYNDEGIYSTMK